MSETNGVERIKARLAAVLNDDDPNADYPDYADEALAGTLQTALDTLSYFDIPEYLRGHALAALIVAEAIGQCGMDIAHQLEVHSEKLEAAIRPKPAERDPF